MEFMTADNLRRLGIRSSWTLGSAGVAAQAGDELCETAARTLSRLPRGARFVDTHRARLLELAHVEAADLILVASNAERPKVVGLSPEARSRTFTMVEAALLAESAVREPRLPWREDEPLGGLLANMQAARGRISLPAQPPLGRRVLRQDHAPDSLDVRDVHTGESSAHRHTLADIRWASEHLSEALAALQPDRAPLRS